ncbi:MAG: alpha-amylase [Verrucomicrobia bacterium]|nr:alpha-amylase [Deltaproteobacteria bacterium]
MTEHSTSAPYFPHIIQIDAQHWRSLELGALSRLIADRAIPDIIFYRQLALRINRRRPAGSPFVHAGQLNMYATLLKVYHHLIEVVAAEQTPNVLEDALKRSGHDPAGDATALTAGSFVELFPPGGVLPAEGRQWLHAPASSMSRQRVVLRELLLLSLAAGNPALDSFREILDDRQLAASSPAYPQLIADMELALSHSPLLPNLEMTLAEALRAPILASPDSLSGQIGFIREHWSTLLPAELLEEVLISFDILLEEERERGGTGEPGPPPVMEFGRAGKRAGGGAGGAGHAGGSSVFGGYEYPEYEHFSTDADWMSNVVLMAKMVYVWLHQLSKQYARPITRLDQIPDAELDRLSGWGFTGLWLIGIWERSPASQHIKQLCGNPEAIASAYSLYDYEIAADLGGWEALHNLKERAAHRGIRLASDMVPNHTGIYSRWVMQHPDWFVQTDYPPFPTYQFNGENLSCSADAVIQVEDGYWTKTDAAVVFRLIERGTGRIRYIYHGNDGTSIPWNDTAQLNYLIPEVREAVVQTILHVARSFPIIRFDAAMTLAKKHFQRLWFPVRGLGGGIPSRAVHGMSREEFDTVFPTEFWREVVDRVAVEVPGTLLLAEAFWLMEGYFVRTLGMHRVYNSAFMNMLKQEENAKYRQTIKNVLEFNPEVLKRFVNFMNNPDEKTAVEQFGREGKYFGACVLLATMPGLPMFGHGQIEGYHEKYGMEYKQSYWNEEPDGHLTWLHEQRIFPLLRCRGLFSGSEHFVLYDFYAGDSVNEDVFAYSNRVGEQRGLVLYHNRYATTAGWVRESVAFAAKSDGDEPQLRRTTLTEALNLGADDQMYYSFQDHTLGLVFLRNSRELSEKGLYAELGEYEFHVFTDFHEIREDAAGTWGRLCTALNGRGVLNLQDELKQLQYAELNAAFRAVLERGLATMTSVSAYKGGLAPPVRRFMRALAAQVGVTAENQHATLAEIPVCLTFLTTLKAVKPSAKTAREMLSGMIDLLSAPGGSKLLLAWLLLKDKQIELDRYGLDYSLKQAQGHGTPAEGHHSAQLLQALLSGESADTTDNVTPLERAFSTAAGRDFMQVHESGRTEWFNKERYEELLEWLAIISLMERAASKPAARTIATWLGSAAAENRRLTELAIHAGYSTTLLLGLLKPVGKNPESGGNQGLTKKPARKKTDVQGTARTQAAKAPDNKVPR